MAVQVKFHILGMQRVSRACTQTILKFHIQMDKLANFDEIVVLHDITLHTSVLRQNEKFVASDDFYIYQNNDHQTL